MKKDRICYISLACLLLMICSCTMTDEHYEVEVHFNERSPWENAIGSRLWYKVQYLSDDGAIEEVYIPEFLDHFTLVIPKGLPCIVAAFPLGQYAPLGISVHPDLSDCPIRDGRISLGLSSKNGDVAARLLEYHKQFAEFFSQMDVELLSDTIWQETQGRPWAVDWGNLYYDLQFSDDGIRPMKMNRYYAVTVPDAAGGYWICDHRGLPITSARDGGGPLCVDLPVGEYVFLNPVCNEYLISVTVSPDAECTYSRIPVSRYLYWTPSL